MSGGVGEAKSPSLYLDYVWDLGQNSLRLSSVDSRWTFASYYVPGPPHITGAILTKGERSHAKQTVRQEP